MSTMAPLPRLRDMIAAVRSPVPGGDALAAPWRGPAESPRAVLWFSRAAFALAALVRWRRAAGQEAPVLWLPDYFCNQSTGPARAAGARIVHYPVGPDLAVDWAACRERRDRSAPDLFVLVHYFGQPSADGAQARAFCDDAGAVLVEDAAHALRPVAGIGDLGDAVLFSPPKVLPVPDGAPLLLGDRIPATEVTAAMPEAAAPSPRPWLARRLVQKLLARPLLDARLRRRLPAFEIDPPFAPLADTPRPSTLGQRLLSRVAGQLAAEAAARQRNAELWVDALAGDGRPFLPAGDWVPYRFVLEAKDGQAAAVYARLAARGCPAESWPDLAPEVMAEPQHHTGALSLRRGLVFLPVHGGIGPADIRRWAG